MTNAQTGETFTLEGLKGPIYVEPMATWCSNCRQQLGNVRDAAAQLGSEATSVALSVETTLTTEDLARYAAEQGFDFTFAVMTPKQLRAFATEFGQAIAVPLRRRILSSIRTATPANSLQGLAPPTQLSRRFSRSSAVNNLFGAFLLGNAAILTNGYLLPLCPGLIAFLAGNAANERAKQVTPWLGLMVLLSILSLMTFVGFLLYLLQATFGSLLSWLLPIIYGLVIILGVLMLFGVNPFARLGVTTTPLVRNPLASAYLYGVLLEPMTLPCTGPLVVSAFSFGAGSAAALASSLLYFFVFGFGFGWLLVRLPFAPLQGQRRSVDWLTRHHTLLMRVSGMLLVGIGVFGVVTELLPQL